jgi:hypothetical protein
MDCYFGIAKDVLIGLITGVVASWTYERLVAIRKSRDLRNQFETLEGGYEEYARNPGSELIKTGGIISLTYRGGTKFSIDASNPEGKRMWHGELFMRADAGVLGAGFYSYDGKDDTGVHNVIYNPELKQFDVAGENTSHPEGVEFKMIWKRKQ